MPIGGISKKDLIEQEAQNWIISDVVPGKDIYLTRTNNILIPSAGIDESNANGHYILWPNNMSQIAQEIHNYFCQRFHCTNIGIIFTDSTTRPLRR
jgi:F420-0:gamma-glutamyl ligase